MDIATLDRFTLTYGHDDLSLWCTHPDCEDNEEPVWNGYGGPDELLKVVAEAAAHEAQHDPTSDADA